MIVEFRVQNFGCFKDEQVLSLVASKDTSLTGAVATKGKFRLLKVGALYGANASGKSTLISALAEMQREVLWSAADVMDQQTGLRPFKLSPASLEEPTVLELTFISSGVRFQYGFSTKDGRFVGEWLLAYPRGRPQVWFDRETDSSSGDTKWWFGPSLRGEKQRLADRTRDNALFLSVAAQWHSEQLSKVYDWFRHKLRVFSDGAQRSTLTRDMLAGRTSGDPEPFRRFLVSSMQKADLGVCDVKVTKKPIDHRGIQFPETMPAEVRESFVKEVLEPRSIRISMGHRCESDPDTPVYLDLEEESRGTQKFFELVGEFGLSMATGGCLVVDELEASLHPLLGRELVQMFIRDEESDNGDDDSAQLFFATHDTTLLEPSLLRRDQVWLVEKGGYGASRVYSLAEYKERKPRKGEAMQKRYLAGLYGGIPLIERFDDVPEE